VGRGEPGSLRAVALPTEHGGWGLTLEPVLLGLAVTPSLAGAGVAAAALAVFLARRPLRLLAADLRRRQRLPRTAIAAGVLAGCLGMIAAGLAAAACLASGPWWWPPVAALPAAAWQIGADLTRRGREFLAEAAGAVAMGAAAPAIVLAGGGEVVTACGLWAVLAARSLPSILLVRAQIRRGRGEPGAAGATHAAHGMALAGIGGLASIGALPWAALGALGALWLWAGISLAHPPVPARTLGWAQVRAGLLVVTVTAAGHHLGW